MTTKLLCLITVLIAAVNVNAQVMRAEELEKYAKERYGEKWTEAAENLASQLSLDKNNSLIDTGQIVSLKISKKLIKESKKFIIETLKLYYSDDIGFYSMFKLTPDNTFITG